MNDPLEKSNPTQAEYFKDIVGTIREPLLVLDKDLRVLAANRSFYKTFKVKQKDTLGNQIYDLGNRQWDIPALRTLLESILPDKAVFNDYEVEYDFPIIGKRSLLLNARRIPAPPIEAHWILLAFEDITERRRLERLLQASEQRFRRAFETAHDGMLLVEKTGGQVLNTNQSAQDMLGYSKQTLHKKKLWELGILKDAGQFRQTTLELEQQGVVELPDLSIPTRQGGHFPADVNLMDRAAVIQCSIRDISERKQSEGVFHELARFPSENPNPVLRIARDGNLLYANEAAFHQLPNWELGLGKPVPELLRNSAREVIEAQKEKTINIPHGERIFSISFTPAQKSEDVNLYARDVTERMKAEEGLGLLASIIESNNDAIIAKTLEGTILSWNPGAEKLYGYPADEVIGKSVSIIVPPDKADELAEILKRIGQDDRFENFETERLTKDGRRLNLSLTISSILDEGGKVIGASTIAHDITGRKKAEAELILANKELIFQNEEKEKRAAELVVANKELVYQNEEKEKRAAELTEHKQAEQAQQQSESLFRALFEASPDAVMLIDPHDPNDSGPIIDCNAVACVMNGYSREELIGHSIDILNRTPVSPAANIAYLNKIRESGNLKYENFHRHKNGTIFPIEVSATLFKVGERELLMGIDRDITERKRMEEEIRNLSLTDELTGLYNRRGFTLLAEQEMKLAYRIKKSMLLFFGDVDDLKMINDTYGHAQGDLALQELAGVLRETFREADILARIGGDEFVVLAVDATTENAEVLTNRLRSFQEKSNQQGDRPYQLTLSLGIALYDPEAPCTVSEMIARADGRMYQQKQARRGK